ncbi:MAG TPA: polysaccharide biosynthesis tyrosine autokinase, partial [Acidobacteriaceae bacterium]
SLAFFACAGGLAGLLLYLGTPSVYRARTSLDIQSLNGDFMNMRNVAPTGEAQNDSSESYVQTQIKLLQSNTLLERSVLKLSGEPHPPYVERNDWLSKIKRAIGLPSQPLSYDAMLDHAARNVKVKPIALTRLVEISCDSWNPDFSAQFCNTLTSEFQDQDHEVRAKEAQQTSEWLTRQVADVRLQVEASERKLEQATGGDGLVLSQENTNVSEDRLRQLQSELVRAQANRMEKEAAFATGTAAAADATPTALDSPTFQAYQQKLADLRGRVAELVPPLTEQNPKVMHLRAQIQEVQSAMTAERSSMQGRTQSDYESAVHRERLLAIAYAAQQATASSELEKANQVNLLRKEADSAQQLYQNLLQRAKEAGFASAMQVTTIRVLDPAKASKLPVAPNRGSSAGVGALMGVLAGIGFIFTRDRVTSLFRAPGDSRRYLDVPELGVIPALTRPRRLVLSLSPGNGKLLHARSQAPGKGEATLASTIWEDKSSIAAEAYRNATYSILLTNPRRDAHAMYVISSPNTGEGKTTVTSNLGIALSHSKRRVVLLDGDLRRPRLCKLFGAESTVGLRNILRGEVDLEDTPLSELCQPTAVPNLFIVPPGTGQEEVTELLHSPSTGEFLARLNAEFDVVLIDTPPMLHMADARILAGHATGVILVVRAGVTSREQALAACDLFRQDQVRVMGSILNAYDPGHEGNRNYYRSYYRYQQEAEVSA